MKGRGARERKADRQTQRESGQPSLAFDLLSLESGVHPLPKWVGSSRTNEMGGWGPRDQGWEREQGLDA